MIQFLKILSTILITQYNITAFDIDTQLNIYTVSKDNNLIIKYSSNEDSLFSVGGFGSSENSFDKPVSITINSLNDIFICDYNNNRVQRFNKSLNFIKSIYLREDPIESHRFGYPLNVAVSRAGNLYILDGENKRIIVTTPFGEWLNTYLGTISKIKLLNPKLIKLDLNDNIYVLDNNKIIMLNPFGAYVKDIVIPDSFVVESFSILDNKLVAISDNFIYIYDLEYSSKIGLISLEKGGSDIKIVNDNYIAISSTNKIFSYNIN
ncbi:MAG: NHL repeat-containing protein [Chlorobiota bacterium]|nr:NHL repeat-containing protein [Chlorobiota bacterium]QQS67192.1 MAG: NHL repeat-containing protein [Chlorobiota bacterium]